MPCRFAGWVPGREEEISRYRPNWNSSAENCGSLTARVLGDPHVGGLVGRGGPAEVQRRAPEQPLVVRDVPAAQVVLGPGGRRGEVRAGHALVVAGDVAVVDVAGCRSTRAASRCWPTGTCSVPPELLTVPPSATARARPKNLTLPDEPSLVAGDPVDRDGRAVRAGHRGALRAVERRGERDRAGPVRGQAHRDHLVRCAGEHLAPDTARRSARRTPPATAVLRSRNRVYSDDPGAAAGERQPQVADGLVRQLRRRDAQHVLVDQALGLAPLVGEDQPAGSAPAPRRRACCSGRTGRRPRSVSSLSCNRSTSTLPNTMAPRRPLPIGSARSQSVPAHCVVPERQAVRRADLRRGGRRTRATPTTSGAATAAPATTAAALSTCLRVTSVSRRRVRVGGVDLHRRLLRRGSPHAGAM